MGAVQPEQDMAQEKMILSDSSEFSVPGIGNPSIGSRAGDTDMKVMLSSKG